MTSLFLRDLKLSMRAGGGALIGVLFFMTVVAVVPFAVGPDLNLLSRIGPAILWIGALLASLLGLDRLFQAEREDGSLDLMLMQETPLVLTVLVKCLAHWTATGLPLVIAAPLLGLFMNMSEVAIGATMLTLLVGTPAIHLHRRDRGCRGGHPAARWIAGLDPCPAAGGPCADLRRQCRLCRRSGSGAISAATADPDCHHAVLRRHRPLGGGPGAAVCVGLGRCVLKLVHAKADGRVRTER